MGILDFFGSLPKRGDVSPEELAARREAYRQAYQDSFLARNRDSKPSSVQALEDYGEYLPLYGDATAFMEAGGLLSEGNRKAAALVAAGGLLGVVPGAGDIVARPLIAAGRKAADIANRIEIDPSMVGSMGGNLKVRPASEAKQSVAEMRRQANIDRFGYDPNEVPDTPPSAGLLSDYVGEHRAPMREDGAPAFNLAGDIYPDDIYSTKAVQYYGTGSDTMDKKTMGLLQSLRGKPDADVTIYRAVPKGVNNLNAGDWVTVNKQYAQDHGESALGGDFDIIEKKVSAKDIFTNGDSIHEFGYDPLPSAPSQGIKAYHGSPHSFDKFSMDKIGTGEGAQVYGRGLYFAEQEDVARMYKDQLSGGASSAGKAKLDRYKGDVDSAIDDTLSNLNRLDERELSGDFVGDEKRLEVLRLMNTKLLRQLNDYKANGNFSLGSMYEVNIKADPDDFLDWDKTVGSQSKRVKASLGWTPDAEQAYLSARNADDDALMAALSEDSSGANYVPTKLPIPEGVPPYDATGREVAGKSSIFGSGQKAAEALKNKGIPGIKYLDQGSRPYGDGTRNYVVFDENLINIVKKYGIAGAATMLGLSQAEIVQAMQAQQPQGLLQ